MMKWKQACVATAAAACLLTGVPAFAQAPDSTAVQPGSNEESKEWQEAREEWKAMRHDHESHRSQRLREAAQYFGIKTDGKTDEQLREELKKARETDPAKWQKFKAELKTKRLLRLQAEAKRLGIATEGKDARALREAIHEKRKADCEQKKEQQQKTSKPKASAPSPA